MKQEKIRKISAYLQSAKNIVIFTHANPDGDAIGSSLTLKHYLMLKGHEADVIVPNDFPAFLAWMPGSADILIHKNIPADCKKAVDEADLLFCLDFNAPERLEAAAPLFHESNAPRILIDHHLEPVDFADVAISETEISSTSELVYGFIAAMGDEHLLNRDIAACIYAGIITDTGSFTYSCNYESTYLAAAKLIATGIDGEDIHRKVYDTYSEHRLRLVGYCLSEKMRVLPEFSLAYIVLTRNELHRFDHQIGDTEGLVNIPLSIAGVKVSALLTERKNYVKLSIRSKGNFSVNTLVRKHFSGGGHRNAAGANICSNIADAEKQFLEIFPLYKDELLNTNADE